MKKYYVIWIPMSFGMELNVIKDHFGPVCEKDIRQVLNRSVKSDETLGSFDEKAYLCKNKL